MVRKLRAPGEGFSSNEGVKEKYPIKRRYFAAIGSV